VLAQEKTETVLKLSQASAARRLRSRPAPRRCSRLLASSPAVAQMIENELLAQDRRDPAMHLDRRNRVLVDQGDGHGLILVHRTSSAFAETLSWPGRRVETTASRLLPMKRAFHTLQRFTPDTHDGAT
jgi:hypothetical protein